MVQVQEHEHSPLKVNLCGETLLEERLIVPVKFHFEESTQIKNKSCQ